MKILRICYEYPPPWDGLTTGPFELSKAQIKLGNNIEYICGYSRKKNFVNEKNLNIHSCGFSLPFISVYFSSAIVAFIKILSLGNKVDIIHGHSYLPFYYHIYRLLQPNKKKYVYHFHITAKKRSKMTKIKSFKMFFKKNITWKLHEINERIACKVADKIIAVSESVKKEILLFYKVDPQKLTIIENGVNLERFNIKSNQFNNIVKNYNEKFLLYVGKLNARKRILKILNLFTFLPNNYKLIIIGKGEKKYLNLLNRSINNNKLHDRIYLLGYIEYPQLPKFYHFSDGFILYSQYEGLPKVLLEAIAADKVVFSTKSFDCNKLIHQYIYWLNGYDYQKDTNIIIKTFRNKKNKSKTRQNILKMNSWNEKAKNIQKIYMELIKNDT